MFKDYSSENISLTGGKVPKANFLKKACETVVGFDQFNEKFRRRISIDGREQSTYRNYIRYLAKIALHFNRLPLTLSSDDIDGYLYYVQQHASAASETSFKHTIFSLRYAFRMEGLTDMRIRLPKIKHVQKLPVVLSKNEMVSMLNKPRLLKHRVLIALLYGCGLRCAEVRNIKVNDIDFHRAMLHVRQGKKKKDRYMPLGQTLALILKNYIEIYNPKEWFFNRKYSKGNNCEFEKNYSQRGIQWAIHSAAKTAGLIKHINVHTLRHTFATHLLEDGVDIMSIKELLGHKKLTDTITYLHVAQISRTDKCSPLDNLQGVKLGYGIQYKLDFSDAVI